MLIVDFDELESRDDHDEVLNFELIDAALGHRDIPFISIESHDNRDDVVDLDDLDDGDDNSLFEH